MGIPQLKSCCGCISLRSGARILGIISLIGSSVMLASILHDIITFVDSSGTDDMEIDSLANSVGLLTHLVRVTTSIFLLVGVQKKKPELVPCWLVSTVVMAVLEACLVPSLAWLVLTHALLSATPFTTPWYLLEVVILVYDSWAWLLVYSYYRSCPVSISSSELLSCRSTDPTDI